ncbi:hypothetical protein BDR22DRAFT_885231 [Usnea florida]
MLPSLCLWALGHASLVLSAPATSPHETPCVPTFNVPDTPKGYRTIPLGPGMHYCDSTSPAVDEMSSHQDTSSTIASTDDEDIHQGDKDDDGDDCESDDESDTDNSIAVSDNANSSHTVSGATGGQGKNTSSGAASSERLSQPSSTKTDSLSSGDISNHTQASQDSTGANKTQNPGPTNSTNSASSNQVYQATITAYGGQCGSRPPACGFLGTNASYQAAVSTYWNTPGLPGQCGTCWRLTDATKIDGNKQKAGPLGTPPIVVMIDNTCAPDPSKPTGGPDGFQCNQNEAFPTDALGSVTVVDLCADTGASDAFWGKEGAPPSKGEDGHTAGLAVASIERVDCGEVWKGEVGGFQDWSRYVATGGAEDAVGVKPGE